MTHSSRSLIYRLLNGPAPLEPLRVLDSRSIQWQDRIVTFYVLGASHAVCLGRGVVEVTELLTCLPPRGSARVLAEARPTGDSGITLPAGGLCCQARLTAEPLFQESGLLGEFEPQNLLYVEYPAEDSKPITRIGWMVGGEMLRIETIHTYPDENRLVRSQTVFRVMEDEI